VIQDFGDPEIEEFLSKWHRFAVTDVAERELLSDRLRSSIYRSPAIRDLASNPLLLTMMAILNRSQELPRDRSDLYEQSSRVLLQEWDVSKFLPDDHRVPRDAIGRKEKQAMLRGIAYEMQIASNNSTPNLIRGDKLEEIIENYLQTLREIGSPKATARAIIEQFRERNFILCFSGDDFYSFVHRTFLEYFCACEIVWRFEKDQSLSLDELKALYREHWRDGSWHELLCLIAGMIGPSFSEQIIRELMRQIDERGPAYSTFLAAKCFSELSQHVAATELGDSLLSHLKDFVKSVPPSGSHPSLAERQELGRIRRTAVALVTRIFKDQGKTFRYVMELKGHWDWSVRNVAIEEAARGWRTNSDLLPWLAGCARVDDHFAVGQTAVREIALLHPTFDVLPILEEITTSTARIEVKDAARFEIGRLRKMANGSER
jgi:predicted NACHT family NTPase